MSKKRTGQTPDTWKAFILLTDAEIRQLEAFRDALKSDKPDMPGHMKVTNAVILTADFGDTKAAVHIELSEPDRPRSVRCRLHAGMSDILAGTETNDVYVHPLEHNRTDTCDYMGPVQRVSFTVNGAHYEISVMRDCLPARLRAAGVPFQNVYCRENRAGDISIKIPSDAKSRKILARYSDENPGRVVMHDVQDMNEVIGVRNVVLCHVITEAKVRADDGNTDETPNEKAGDGMSAIYATFYVRLNLEGTDDAAYVMLEKDVAMHDDSPGAVITDGQCREMLRILTDAREIHGHRILSAEFVTKSEYESGCAVETENKYFLLYEHPWDGERYLEFTPPAGHGLDGVMAKRQELMDQYDIREDQVRVFRAGQEIK